VPAAPVFPLTGMPVDDAGRAARPALVVKIENEQPARPQSGLQAADVVYEEIIEGGDTRFAAIFQSTDTDPVGPLRSVRPTDPFLVRPLGAGLFAYSGGTRKFVDLLHATSMIDVGESARGGAYYRRGDKRAPHNLYSSTARLYGAGGGGGKPPPPLFAFVAPGQPFSPAGARPTSHLETVVGTQHIFYDWDPAAAGWRRAINGQPHVVEGGGQLVVTNVVVQFVSWVPSPGDFDPLHAPVFVAQLVGSGDAWFLAGGQATLGHWSKASAEAPIAYTGPDGQPIQFVPGRTWIELTQAGNTTIVR
ncbi:MAG TPA: DUF3048 domain-containing protein, partial [Actinomycetota bacterium]|nr:DUF3048 domain-containing protein [Actinomycetota bacterium]